VWDEWSLGGPHELYSRLTTELYVGMIRHTLEEEIEVVDGGDATIDDCSRARISILVSICLLGRIESGMMTFALLDG